MRKKNSSQQPTPGTIKHLQGALKLAVDENLKYEKQLKEQEELISFFTQKTLKHKAIIEYLEKRLERSNPV
jgi:hypothetical protein